MWDNVVWQVRGYNLIMLFLSLPLSLSPSLPLSLSLSLCLSHSLFLSLVFIRPELRKTTIDRDNNNSSTPVIINKI